VPSTGQAPQGSHRWARSRRVRVVESVRLRRGKASPLTGGTAVKAMIGVTGEVWAMAPGWQRLGARWQAMRRPSEKGHPDFRRGGQGQRGLNLVSRAGRRGPDGLGQPCRRLGSAHHGEARGARLQEARGSSGHGREVDATGAGGDSRERGGRGHGRRGLVEPVCRSMSECCAVSLGKGGNRGKVVPWRAMLSDRQ